MASNEEFSLKPIEDMEIFKKNSKLWTRLKQTIEQESFYETHQLYKTINFRCTTNNLPKEGLDIVYNGITYFASRNNSDCVFDLAKLFVEILKTNNFQVDSELTKRVKNIHSFLKNKNEERTEFSASVLKWSGTLFAEKQKSNTKDNVLIAYQKKFGHADIHEEFAKNFWSEENYILARYHFLHSFNGEQFGNMIIEMHSNYGYPSECDLFLTQSVLQLLYLRNETTAESFFKFYLKNHPQLKVNSQLPLVNFVNFLFLAIKKGNSKTFRHLLSIYKPSLDRDISFRDYLDKIGQVHFNIKKKPEKKDLFSSLIQALTNETEDANLADVKLNAKKNEENDDDDDDDEDDFYENDLLD